MLIHGIELEHLSASRDARAQALGEHLFVAVMADDAKGDHGALTY